MQYIVTAINNLTGEREAVSSPRSWSSANALMEKHKAISRYKRQQPWSKFKVTKYEEKQSPDSFKSDND